MASNFARAGSTLYGIFYYLGSTTTTWNFLMRVSWRTLRHSDYFFFSFLNFECGPQEFNYEEIHLHLTWLPYFLQKRYPFRIIHILLTNSIPFTYTLSIISNCSKCTHFKIWISHKTRTFSRLFHSHKMLLSALLTSTGKNRTISTHEMEIRIPEYGKILLMESGLHSSRNPESH